MLDDVMRVQREVEVYCARVTCGLCLAAGPAVEERPEHDQEDVGQEGGQKGRKGWGSFFFPPPKAQLEQVHLYGEATRMYWGTLYSLVCCMANVDPI